MNEPSPPAPPDSRSRPPRPRSPAPAIVPATVAITVLSLSAVALAEPGAGALAICCLIAAAALAAAAVAARNATAAVLAVVLAATAALGLAGVALGRRASTSSTPGHPFPLVVGLPLRQAEAMFQRHGPVRFQIKRVAYGARGTVLRATGYSPDGTYAPGSTIALVVGTYVPIAGSPYQP